MKISLTGKYAKKKKIKNNWGLIKETGGCY